MSRILMTAAFAVCAVAFAGKSWAPDLSLVLGDNDWAAEEKAKNAQSDRRGCVAYWIVVTTGDVANGGTDGTISMTINGRNGSTGEFTLGGSGSGWEQPAGASRYDECQGFVRVYADDDNPANNFEAGSVERYTILAPRIGNVDDIIVRMDAAGTAGSGWYLQSVDVERGEPIGDAWRRTGDFYLGIHNNWLESGVPVTVSDNNKSLTTYEIVFQTGTDTGAGTDSDITIRLEGTSPYNEPVTVEQVVNPFISGNAFENGSRDKAVLPQMPSIKRLTSVTVTTADNYAGSAWQLASVEVSSPSLCGGSPGAECKFATAEVLSFGNVWLDGSTRSKTVAAGSIPARAVTPDTSNQSQPEICADLLGLTTVDRNAAAKMCPRSTDGYRDAACLLVASVYRQPADIWADKCIDDPEGASAELNRLGNPGYQPPPPPPPEPEAGPGARPAGAPPQSEEERCRGMVDGRVAYDRSGSKSWNPDNINRLCAGATDADARIACFEGRIAAGEGWDSAIDACAANDSAGAPGEPLPSDVPPQMGPPPGPGPDRSGGSEEARCMAMVDGQVAWDQNGSTGWEPGNIAALCAGATDADARIACFESRIAAGEGWQTAIPACAANDGSGGGGAAAPPSGSSAEAQSCKAMLQDQVPWQTDPTIERHWAEEDLDALCDGSTNAAATVRCFQEALYNNGNGSDIYTAIDACREN